MDQKGVSDPIIVHVVQFRVEMHCIVCGSSEHDATHCAHCVVVLHTVPHTVCTVWQLHHPVSLHPPASALPRPPTPHTHPSRNSSPWLQKKKPKQNLKKKLRQNGRKGTNNCGYIVGGAKSISELLMPVFLIILWIDIVNSSWMLQLILS